MDKKKVIEYLEREYGISPDYPFEKYTDCAVFRHRDNKKWFGIVMSVRCEQLGLEGKEDVFILNVKLGPKLLGSFLQEKGFFRAYHMNKENWASIILDGSVSEELLKTALDISYDLTKKKTKKHP